MHCIENDGGEGVRRRRGKIGIRAVHRDARRMVWCIRYASERLTSVGMMRVKDGESLHNTENQKFSEAF